MFDLARFSASPHPWATHSHVRRCTVWSCFNFTHPRSMQSRQILVPVLCASACPVCVSCVSRLPPVSFYRYMFLPPGPLYRRAARARFVVGVPRQRPRWPKVPRRIHSLRLGPLSSVRRIFRSTGRRPFACSCLIPTARPRPHAVRSFGDGWVAQPRTADCR